MVEPRGRPAVQRGLRRLHELGQGTTSFAVHTLNFCHRLALLTPDASVILSVHEASEMSVGCVQVISHRHAFPSSVFTAATCCVHRVHQAIVASVSRSLKYFDVVSSLP